MYNFRTWRWLAAVDALLFFFSGFFVALGHYFSKSGQRLRCFSMIFVSSPASQKTITTSLYSKTGKTFSLSGKMISLWDRLYRWEKKQFKCNENGSKSNPVLVQLVSIITIIWSRFEESWGVVQSTQFVKSMPRKKRGAGITFFLL